MKNKKSFSKFDYYLMLLDDFKDQYTLVVVLNFILIYIGNLFNQTLKTMYLRTRFSDWFDILSNQFDLSDYFKVLGYVFLASIGIHFAIYKKNIKWMFRTNAFFTLIVTSYVWGLLTLDSILSVLENGHVFFILTIIGQLLFYIIVGNELIQFVNFKRKQPEINHS